MVARVSDSLAGLAGLAGLVALQGHIGRRGLQGQASSFGVQPCVIVTTDSHRRCTRQPKSKDGGRRCTMQLHLNAIPLLNKAA